jgi:hypothetical protein
MLGCPGPSVTLWLIRQPTVDPEKLTLYCSGWIEARWEEVHYSPLPDKVVTPPGQPWVPHQDEP